MKKPSFFIVGAPKAGTTSVCELLRSYEGVYIPSPAEPNFWCDDINGIDIKTHFEWYIDHYFGKLPKRCNLIGEKSTWYLASNNALLHIHKFNPDAKIIIMLRNPSDLVISLHKENLYHGIEEIDSLEDAWNLQESRAEGLHLPKKCKYSRLLQYRDMASLGKQLENVYKVFPKEQIFVRTIEDLKYQKEFIKDLETFLSLHKSNKISIPMRNTRKSTNKGIFHRILTPPVSMVRLAEKAKSLLGIRSFGIGNRLHNIRVRLDDMCQQNDDHDIQIKRKLVGVFSDEVTKIEKLTSRNFSHWRHV